jgi:nucleoside-diphosphate-sugar epimerase
MKVLITGAAGFLGRRLTAELIARGHLRTATGDSPIDEIILADRAPVNLSEFQTFGGLKITQVTGDLSDPGDLTRVCTYDFDTLFHLASQLTFHAENAPDQAYAVNVTPLRALIGSSRGTPRGVFASSIAVFGGDLPAEVDDHLQPLPQTTYGVHKAINELLIADASRHGRIDGRSLRLPIVLIRPGLAQPVVSDQVAAIAREPLEGRDFQAPLSPEPEVPVCSAGAVVRGLIALHEARAEDLPPKRALNLPALTVTVAEMVAAAVRAGATGRVHSARNAAMQAVVAGWPTRFISRHAAGLGINTDADFDAVIADYLATRPNAD